MKYAVPDHTKPWRSPHYLTKLAPFMDHRDWRALDGTALGVELEWEQQERWNYEDEMHTLELESYRAEERAYLAAEQESAYYESLATVTDEGDWFYGVEELR